MQKLIADLYAHIFLLLTSVMDWMMKKRRKRLLDSFNEDLPTVFENELEKIKRVAERVRNLAAQNSRAEARSARLTLEETARDIRVGLEGERRHQAEMKHYAESILREQTRSSNLWTVDKQQQLVESIVGLLEERAMGHNVLTYEFTHTRYLKIIFCRDRLRLPAESFNPIMVEPEALRRIGEWAKASSPNMLWLEGQPIQADDFDNPITMMAAKIIGLTEQTRMPVISYFCHPASNSSDVIEFLGIPYVKPPVGDLRFDAPQRFTDNASYEAAKFGFDCPLSPSRRVDYPEMTPQAQQIIGNFASAAGTPQSEDCLTLNIWSKATKKALLAGKPVIVFFYGGRFAIGNTNSPFYNGKYFAEAQDVIVITVNYRINIFGFPGAPGQPQNLGLRDQRAAVEWVRDNIAGFGGDPAKITIAGQSSGGVSVDYWSYAYTEDPIVNGLIAPSGNAFSFPLNSPEVPERNWNTVVASVNCTNATDVMACMRAQKWEDIKAAAAAVRPTSSSSVLRAIPPFYPRVDNETVFPDYVALTKSGSFAKLPILFGNNQNEDGYYRIPAYGNGVVPSQEQVASFLLESFTCPNSYQGLARLAQNIPAWIYRYFGDWENTRLFPTSGAYHGVDLHMIFGASEDVSGLATSEPQKRTTVLMQQAWAAFANDPANGLTSVLGWPKFDPSEESLALLAVGNDPKPRFVKPDTYDAPCSTITMGALATPAPA
ncbi:hypothetical protein EsH8_I_000286 [Colletotrichum jinshuiense]